MNTPSLQPAPTYGQLVAQLQKRPAHVATSFDLKEAWGMKPQASSIRSPLRLPQAGIQTVDSFVGTTNSLLDLTASTAVDVPKEAIKGGFYGSIGGGIAGLLAWPILKLPKVWGVGVSVGMALLGGLLGSVIKTGHEIFNKARQLFNIVF